MTTATPVAYTRPNTRLDDVTEIPFESVRSRCPNGKFSADQRSDPFWGGMWGGGSHASWISRGFIERMGRHGSTPHNTVPAIDRTTYQAVKDLADRGNRQRHPSRKFDARLQTLAVTQMWRTVTAEQLAAFTGMTIAANRSTMVPAFLANLVKRGSFVGEIVPTPRRTNYVYRPVNSPMFKQLSDLLLYNEWVSLTAGMDWSSGPPHDRHNVLAAELALRIAEYCDVGTVLGESVCKLDLLSTDYPCGNNSRADATIVRPDGHRIAIELTSSTGPGFKSKAEKWAETIYRTDQKDIGLTVLFVDASPSEAPPARRRSTWADIRSGVGRAAYSQPGYAREGVPRRMAVTRWEWLFPSPGHYSDALTTLLAETPTGPSTDRWQRSHLLDTDDHPTAVRDMNKATTVIRNAQNLWGTPEWLRRSKGPDVTAIRLAELGLDERIIIERDETTSRSSSDIDDWLTEEDAEEDVADNETDLDDWLS